jgi:hypothetical protein
MKAQQGMYLHTFEVIYIASEQSSGIDTTLLCRTVAPLTQFLTSIHPLLHGQQVFPPLPLPQCIRP